MPEQTVCKGKESADKKVCYWGDILFLHLVKSKNTLSGRGQAHFSRRIGGLVGTEWQADSPGKGTGPGKKGGCRHCVGNAESIRKISKIARTRRKYLLHPITRATGSPLGTDL
jgi:hypothetical protein